MRLRISFGDVFPLIQNRDAISNYIPDSAELITNRKMILEKVPVIGRKVHVPAPHGGRIVAEIGLHGQRAKGIGGSPGFDVAIVIDQLFQRLAAERIESRSL